MKHSNFLAAMLAVLFFVAETLAATSESNSFFNKLPKIERKGPAAWANIKANQGNGPQFMRKPSPLGYTAGTNKFPVVLVYDNSEPRSDLSDFDDMLNEVGYSRNNYLGSIRDYFIDQSVGKFVPEFDVYTAKLDEEFSFYVGFGLDSLVKEVAAKLKENAAFNAAKYDADGDGEVDNLSVVFAGTLGKEDEKRAQSYMSYLGSVDAGNGKKFNTHIIIWGNGAVFSPFVHEFGHALGLYDLYSTNGVDLNWVKTWGVQAPGVHGWGVMTLGVHSGNGYVAPGYNAFEKNFLGWLDFDTLDLKADVITIEPLEISNKAYMIPVPNNPDEWFILENRQKNKWDFVLPSHGLLIWHVDYDEYVWNSSLNDDAFHQYVDLVEAGSKMVPNYNDGGNQEYLVDDPFPGSENVTEFYGFKSWSGLDLGINLYGIMEENKNICFTTKKGVKVTTCDVKKDAFKIYGSLQQTVEEDASIEPITISGVKSYVRNSWMIYFLNIDYNESEETLTITSTVPKYTNPVVYKESFTINGEVYEVSLDVKKSNRVLTRPSIVVDEFSTNEDVTALSAITTFNVELRLQNDNLQVFASGDSRKNVAIFDMQGNKVYGADFNGTSYGVNLASFKNKVLLVRVTENGILLKQNRITVK